MKQLDDVSFHVVPPMPVAFTPKGGCPLKPCPLGSLALVQADVAFTPKGGCPLKPAQRLTGGWLGYAVAFTPKGGCPLKLFL